MIGNCCQDVNENVAKTGEAAWIIHFVKVFSLNSNYQPYSGNAGYN